MTNWFSTALRALPLLATLVPRAGELLPLLLRAVGEAQRIPNATGVERHALALDLVREGATAASVLGVHLDPDDAVAIANALFELVDHIHNVVKANQPPAALPAA